MIVPGLVWIRFNIDLEDVTEYGAPFVLLKNWYLVLKG